MNFEEIRNLLQERIIRLTNSKNLSMCQLSLRIGKSPDYIQKVVSGKITPPLSVIVDICNTFDITISEMFDTSIMLPEKHHALIRLIQYLPEKQLEGLIMLLSKR